MGDHKMGEHRNVIGERLGDGVRGRRGIVRALGPAGVQSGVADVEDRPAGARPPLVEFRQVGDSVGSLLVVGGRRV